MLLVAAGISDEGYTNTSEIIGLKHNPDSRKTESQKYRKTERQIVDLKKTSDVWNDPKQLPTMLDTPLAGYLDESIPLLCGMSVLKIFKSLYLTWIISQCCFKNLGSITVHVFSFPKIVWDYYNSHPPKYFLFLLKLYLLLFLF